MEYKKRNIKLFLISGIAGSGKTKTSEYIKKYYDKKDTIIISFGHYIKDYVMRISNWDGREDTKPRDLLQKIGIELIKNKIDKKLFINRIIEDIEIFSYFYDIIIVNDVRLIDEIVSLKEKYKKSISIRITRDNYDNGLTNNQKKHITETNLNDFESFDYYIKNNGDDTIKYQLNEILGRI